MSLAETAATSRESGIRPPRTALVAGETTLRDLGPVARHMVVGLLDELIPVTIVSPEEDPGRLAIPAAETIGYRRRGWPVVRRRDEQALAERLSAAGPKLLHALDESAAPLTRSLAAELDLPYALSLYDLRPRARLFEPRCRAVLAAGEPIASRAVKTRAVPERILQVLRPGLHAVRRARCFIDPNHAPAIVAAGSLDESAAFGAVIDAFASVHERRPDAVFFILGSGRGEHALRRRAEQAGLLRELTFVDRNGLEQFAGVVRAADVFIAPVASSRVKLELLAAMAAGVPALTAGSQADDFVVPGETALTFRPADGAELAMKLTGLLDDRATARRLAEAALAHLREHHSPARTAGQLAGLYRRLTGQRTTAGE